MNGIEKGMYMEDRRLEEMEYLGNEVEMTKERFDELLDFFLGIDDYANCCLLMEKYFDFIDEVKKPIPELTEKEAETAWNRFCAKMKEKYGIDVI